MSVQYLPVLLASQEMSLVSQYCHLWHQHKPGLLKQMSPSQGSIPLPSHHQDRIRINLQVMEIVTTNPWIGTTIPQSILTLHMNEEGWERNLDIPWKPRFCRFSKFSRTWTLFASLGEIYCLRQDEWFTGTVTVFSMRGDMPKTIKIIRNGRHFYTRLTWQKYCSPAC